jgi:16S rRNA (cytidine1402-2'-O)-methyltransferase
MKRGEGETVFRVGPLAEGLHVVSTPIGAARDITLRALDVLASADVLAAEDTRVLRRLMEIHGVPVAGRPLLPYHDHNGAAQRPVLLAHLARGARVAYASDAGTPLVADPGFALVRDAAAAGHPVHAVPGASALLAGLVTAGLPSDRFLFAGFPPPRAAARRTWLEEVAAVKATLVIYETGRRIGALLADLAALGHGGREAVLCRELTKRFEEAQRGSVDALAARHAAGVPRGEIVLVLGPPPERPADAADIEAALRAALAEAPLKQAATRVAAEFGARKRDVYQMGLAIDRRRPEEDGDDSHDRD